MYIYFFPFGFRARDVYLYWFYGLCLSFTLCSFYFLYSGGVAGGKNEGSGHVWMSNLGCKGDEYSLVFCPFRGWGKTGCRHKQDMAIECSPPTGMGLLDKE